jgi:hypothetical protein
MKFDELYNGVMNEGLGYYGYGPTGTNRASRSHEAWKSRERNAGLEGEERQQRDADRGPWYIKIDGAVYKQQGQPKVFDWRKGANNYALAILKNNPSLQGKIRLTKEA